MAFSTCCSEDLLLVGRWYGVHGIPIEQETSAASVDEYVGVKGSLGKHLKYFSFVFKLYDDQLLMTLTSWYSCPYLIFSPCGWAGSSDLLLNRIRHTGWDTASQIRHKKPWLLSCFTISLWLFYPCSDEASCK